MPTYGVVSLKDRRACGSCFSGCEEAQTSILVLAGTLHWNARRSPSSALVVEDTVKSSLDESAQRQSCSSLSMGVKKIVVKKIDF